MIAPAEVTENLSGKAVVPSKRRMGSQLVIPSVDIEAFVVTAFH